MPFNVHAAAVPLANRCVAVATIMTKMICANTSSRPARHFANQRRQRSPGKASRNGSVPTSRSPASSMAPQIRP